MKILVIGGTRNLGRRLVQRLVGLEHRVTIFNRGKTPDDLPEVVERLHGDRTDAAQLMRALQGRTFDVVVDTALYKGAEVEPVVRLFKDRIGQYIFLSSGQVYLVREGIERPFDETDYEGRLMPSPKPNTYGYEEWMYGIEKRRAEDALKAAWETQNFPYTTLRLPMVNSERDHFHRLYNYILRLKDGGPILAPSTPNYPLRHVYADDVVTAFMKLIDGSGVGKGEAYNISQDESVSLEEFLTILGGMLGVEAHIVRVRRDTLEANGFLPDCSPFSERWMSELDNTRSKTELGMTYTPLSEYLEKIVAYYAENPPLKPASYHRRRAELLLLEHSESLV
ncbi:MAG: NAD-dependent epimerase/dehydratase family protein [Chloroflexi bacterium]|nr:NAD-dependent epimerase/dehydratase family protein [Chloroflexota bacterium]